MFRGSFFPKKEEQEDVRKQKQLKIKRCRVHKWKAFYTLQVSLRYWSLFTLGNVIDVLNEIFIYASFRLSNFPQDAPLPTF